MPNPSVGGFGALGDGILLAPWPTAYSMDFARCAWIASGTPVAGRARDEDVLDLPGRADPVTISSGVLRLDRGSISGLLIDRHDLTAEEWRQRLEYLIEEQGRFQRIWMVTPTLHYPNVELGSMERGVTQAGGKAWRVELEFREKR